MKKHTGKSPNVPKNYSSKDYPPFAVTVDLAIFTIRNGLLSILLVERKDDPYAGFWALPGGFVNVDENLDTAASRELKEETGVTMFAGHMEQLKTYGTPKRDPRMRVVSVGYVAFAPNLPTPVAGSDAAKARWWPVEDVVNPTVEEQFPLAFDHKTIITDALDRVRAKLEYTTLASQFLEEPFTLADLYRVYEAVWGEKPDLGNFRRKVLSTKGFVTEVEGTVEQPSRGRPATLYRGYDAIMLNPPFTRKADET